MHIRLGNVAEMGLFQKIAGQGYAESGEKFLHFHDRFIWFVLVKSLINDFFIFGNFLTFGKFFLLFRAEGFRKFCIDNINDFFKIMSLYFIEIVIFQLRLQLMDNTQRIFTKILQFSWQGREIFFNIPEDISGASIKP